MAEIISFIYKKSERLFDKRIPEWTRTVISDFNPKISIGTLKKISQLREKHPIFKGYGNFSMLYTLIRRFGKLSRKEREEIELYRSESVKDEIVRISGFKLPLEDIKDYQQMLHLVSVYGSCIQYASEDLRDDYDLAYIAVSTDWIAYQDLSDRLKKNMSICIRYLLSRGGIYLLPKEILRDKSFMLMTATKRTILDVTRYITSEVKQAMKIF